MGEAGVLSEVADGVLVRQSAFCLSNAIVVRAAAGVLLIDPGIDGDDLAALADDVGRLGLPVLAGFATHPHWDHLLWHRRFGDVPRYATATCAATAAARMGRDRAMAGEFAPGAPLDLLGLVSALPADATSVPWDGPAVRVVEHQAHAPGHAAVVIESSRVLLAGDMLSDVEIPLLDPDQRGQCSEYLRALDVLAALHSDGLTVLVPGHGAVARGSEIGARIDTDRRYVQQVCDGVEPHDPRLDPAADYGTDWMPHAHETNLRYAAEDPHDGQANGRAGSSA